MGNATTQTRRSNLGKLYGGAVLLLEWRTRTKLTPRLRIIMIPSTCYIIASCHSTSVPNLPTSPSAVLQQPTASSVCVLYRLNMSDMLSGGHLLSTYAPNSEPCALTSTFSLMRAARIDKHTAHASLHFVRDAQRSPSHTTRICCTVPRASRYGVRCA